jgi:acetoin utilization deacetylase AcuC-like enzyme
MQKYALLRQQLEWEGIVDEGQWITPGLVDMHPILRAHEADYLTKLELGQWTRNEERKSGFPWSPALIEREKTIMEGTRLCARIAAEGGVALNIAGGTHHAFRNRAEGFCLLNDLAIAAFDLLHQGLERVLIVDLDVHQGNGTAHITQGVDAIYTFSMHGASNYPLHKELSDWDISLSDATRDRDYLSHLERALDEISQTFRPEVILYQCGVDVLASDKLGRLALTMQGCLERDQMVFNLARNLGIGVACVMGGGYSEDVQTIVNAHMATFRLARDAWT